MPSGAPGDMHLRAQWRAIDWAAWRPDERATLCFARRDGEILLIHKKRGLGAGKINGPGGKLEPGENAEQCARRELREEVGLRAGDLIHAGGMSFQFTDGYALRVEAFQTFDFTGLPVETDEAKPYWFRLDRLPYERMWADDRIWLPLMFRGLRFESQYLFDGDHMVGHRVYVR